MRTPLHSHLRGALRTGWSREDLGALLDAFEPYSDAPTLEFAREILTKEIRGQTP